MAKIGMKEAGTPTIAPATKEIEMASIVAILVAASVSSIRSRV